MTLSLGYVGIYVVLAGVASFIEEPAGRGFGAFQLNALIRAGSLAAAAVALVFAHGLVLPAASYLLAGLGIGLLTGAGSILPLVGVALLAASTATLAVGAARAARDCGGWHADPAPG